MAETGSPGRVVIIGADHWPRAYLRAELIERGYDAVGFETLDAAALDRAMSPARALRLIVIDLHAQRLDEKRLAWLFRQGVPVIAVAGAAEAAGGRLAQRPWAALLRRPITIGAIADAAARALGEDPAPARA